MKPGDEVEFVSEFDATCPCGRKIEVGTCKDVPCVLHVEPYCKEFIEKDMLEYLHWVNVMKGYYN